MKATIATADPTVPEGYRIPSHGGGKLKPWKPGESGNLTVKRADYREVLALAREASPTAMRTLIKAMDHKDKRIAIVAADKVLERAWGRVKDVDPSAAVDPEASARREQMRTEVIRMLQALAVPEPLTVDNAVVVPDAVIVEDGDQR